MNREPSSKGASTATVSGQSLVAANLVKVTISNEMVRFDSSWEGIRNE
jgi:hypothetical protein